MRHSVALTSWALCVTFWATACPAPDIDTDPLSDLPRYEEQRRRLCERGRVDAVTAVFCRPDPPPITSLVELQTALGMSFVQAPRPGFSLTTNSTGLSARSVSSINPRAVLVNVPADREDGNFVSLAYSRGDALVELAARPPNGPTALYLLRYEQPCDEDEAGCSFEERLTPATEGNWARWSLYDDVDLKNTVFDCLQCHQPAGPGTPVDFRMQEFQNPWTHWLAAFGVGESALLTDYANAHGLSEGDEDYAGIPPRTIVGASNPIIVELFFKASGSVEPNPFPSRTIEDEVTASSPGQPVDNTIPGRSPTWDALYERSVRGEVIPPPYHDVKITDPGKLESMSAAYRAWRAGTLDGPLPDIRDVIRDDALADLSMRPKPGLTGREILVHMCAHCHNPRLDQSLTRARFDALNLDAMSRAVKDTAIDRLQRSPFDRLRMPPHILRDLSADEIASCIEELRR